MQDNSSDEERLSIQEIFIKMKKKKEQNQMINLEII